MHPPKKSVFSAKCSFIDAWGQRMPCIRSSRRAFLAALVNLALALPRAANAQQPAIPTVGILNGMSSDSYASRIAAVRQGLADSGFVEGQNLAIEYRSADGHYERLQELAAGLVHLRVDVIVTIGSSMAARAAKAATPEIPVVFMLGADPVKAGLVTSLSQPAGNLTGVTNFAVELAAKRLELLHELKPDAKTIAYIINPGNLVSEDDAKVVAAAGHAIGCEIVVVRARTAQDIDTAMATIAQRGIPANLQGDALFSSQRQQIAKLAAQYGIPVMHGSRENVLAGGLISYAPDVIAMSRMTGVYAGRILKGAKPADLPVQQPTKYELIINLKAARALGLAIPSTLLARADQVIE
jgi:putative ABC transport system substrate-binding protein